MTVRNAWYPEKRATLLDLREAQGVLLGIKSLESRQAYKGDVESLKAIDLYKKALRSRIEDLRSSQAEEGEEEQRDFRGIPEEDREKILKRLRKYGPEGTGPAIRFLDAMDYWVEFEANRELQNTEKKQIALRKKIVEMSTILTGGLDNSGLDELLKTKLNDLHDEAQYQLDLIYVPPGRKIEVAKDRFIARVLMEIHRHLGLENFLAHGTKKALNGIVSELCKIAGHSTGNIDKRVREIKKLTEEKLDRSEL